jgi:hypothetical protein
VRLHFIQIIVLAARLQKTGGFALYWPLARAKVVGGTHSPGGEGDGGSIFWTTRHIGLTSCSNFFTVRGQGEPIQRTG